LKPIAAVNSISQLFTSLLQQVTLLGYNIIIPEFDHLPAEKNSTPRVLTIKKIPK